MRSKDRPTPVAVEAPKLLDAGGVDDCFLTSAAAQRENWATSWLIRNPADVFFYSGNATADGCLTSTDGQCWGDARRVLSMWKKASQIEVLILAAPYALQMRTDVSAGRAVGGPGASWSTLLASRQMGGGLVAILGYRDEVPSRVDVGQQIAQSMGERIAAGLRPEDWVQAWLEINGDNPGTNAWNAVGLDAKGD